MIKLYFCYNMILLVGRIDESNESGCLVDKV